MRKLIRFLMRLIGLVLLLSLVLTAIVIGFGVIASSTRIELSSR